MKTTKRVMVQHCPTGNTYDVLRKYERPEKNTIYDYNIYAINGEENTEYDTIAYEIASNYKFTEIEKKFKVKIKEI